MTTMTSGPTSEAIGVEEFRSELSRLLAPMRHALGRLLGELGSPQTPTLLQRRVGVGYTVCWQVFRVVKSDDVAVQAQHAPSKERLKRLLAAAGERGVAPDTLDAVRDAADEFHGFVQQHAEDRAAFDSMVAGTTSAEQSKSVLVQRRRAHYRSGSHVWGVQTELQLLTAMVRRSTTDAARCDAAWISLKQGIRRLRVDAQVKLTSYHTNPGSADGELRDDNFVGHAFDQAAAERLGMPVIPEFSTTPLPTVECATSSTGFRSFNMLGSTLGLRSNFDVATGRIDYGVPMIVESDGRRVPYVNFISDKPVAMLVIDVLVHRDSLPGVRLQRLVHQSIPGPFTLEAALQAQQVTIEEQVTLVGRADAATLTEFSRYPEMLRYAGERLGWDLADFDLHRLRLPYPILGTSTRLYFEDPL